MCCVLCHFTFSSNDLEINVFGLPYIRWCVSIQQNETQEAADCRFLSTKLIASVGSIDLQFHQAVTHQT